MAGSIAANATTMSGVGGNADGGSALTMLHQLESMMKNKDLENKALRRRVQILEGILKSHGIGKVVPVNDELSHPDVVAITTEAPTESESVSSLTHEPVLSLPPSIRGKATTASPKKTNKGDTKQSKKKKGVLKVPTVVEEDESDDDDDDDDIDDDATARTTATNATMNTFYTRRSLIMPPPDVLPIEPDPHPQGTQPGGRWYKQTFKGYKGPEPWSVSLSCSCSVEDVDTQDIRYVYYDRKGTHKYFSPHGVQVASPIHSRGTSLSAVPHDGTMRAYFVKMGLPLYHQKQHTHQKQHAKLKAVRIRENSSNKTGSGSSSVISGMTRPKTQSR